jgi:hypothetical protein
MRWAKSYSIVDHALLHGGYLHRLRPEAMALYLFLVVVSDREGKSYYAERTVSEILRLSPEIYSLAKGELIEAGLISYRAPHFWVRNIEGVSHGERGQRATPKTDSLPQRDEKPIVQTDSRSDWDLQKARVQDLLRTLGTKCSPRT